MKSFINLFAILLLTLNASSQTCTPNQSYINSPAGLYPSQLPQANFGQSYNTQLDIKTSTDTAAIFQGIPVQLKIKAMKLLDVVGEPSGFIFTPTYNDLVNNTWQNAGADPNWTPVIGCIQISASQGSVDAAANGGPNNDGIYPISIYLDVLVKGNPIPSSYSWVSTLGNPPYGSAYRCDYTLVIQGGIACVYNFQVSNSNFNSAGGAGTIIPNTQTGCSWNVTTTNQSMITGLPTGIISGNSSVNFNVTSCSGSSRTGDIVVTDENNFTQSFTITQTCGGQSCTYNFQVPSLNFTNTGGIGTINPNTQSNCTWTVSTDNPTMITGLPSNTISGNTSINFGISSCSGSPRTGNINIIDGNNVSQSFTISQTCSTQGNDPTANFFAAQTSYTGPCPVLIDFFDQSTNTPTQWVWEFLGNGINPAASTLQNPTDVSYSQSGSYTVKLTVYNSSGVDDTVKVGYIDINCTVGIEEMLLGKTSIYPNPASNVFNIKIEASNFNKVFELYNISGQKIDIVNLKGVTGNYIYNSTSLVSGIYFYNLISNNNLIERGKIVIVK